MSKRNLQIAMTILGAVPVLTGLIGLIGLLGITPRNRTFSSRRDNRAPEPTADPQK